MASRDGPTEPRGDRFVGRERALDEVAEALRAARLVELVGPAGVGKTRLCREVARRGTAPARFCDLTEATSLGAFLLAVARSLAVSAPLDASLDALAERIRRRVADDEPLLLVLDNFEQLPAAADAALAGWFERPGARVLVTSRRRLAGAPATARTIALEPLSTEPRSGERWSEAAELLVARAEAVRGPDTLRGADGNGPEDRATLEQLARELDGLPLALELCAARFRMLAPRQVLARLSERFRMLRRPDGTLGRADLFESIGGSFAMLGPEEQDAFLACSVFRGGFALDAAEAVVGTPGGAWPLDLLEGLVDQSMVTVDRDPQERRYDLLICMREFADGELRLRPEGARPAMARHAVHHVALGERLVGAGDAGARRGLERERENLRAVVERRDVVGAELALRAALVLASPVAALPYLTVAEALDCALGEGDASDAPPRLVARALLERGNLRRFLGRRAESTDDLERARAAAEAIGEPALVAEALAGLGNTTSGSGDWKRARDFFERARAVATEPRLRGRILVMHANSFGGTDDYDAAVPLFREGIREAERAGDTVFAATARLALAVILLAAGTFDESRALIGEALEVLGRSGSPHWEGVGVSWLARCKQETGDLDGALALYPDALLRLEAAGVHRAQAVAFYQFGTALLEAGELDAAAKQLRLALPLARDNCREYEGLILAAQGVVAARRGAAADADVLYGRAEAALRAQDKPTFLAAVRVLRGEDPPQAMAAYAEVRLALRLRAPLPAGAPPPPLLVARDGSWFRAPGSETSVPLERRKSIRGVLRALAQQREERPGEPASLPALIEAGWPGERILAAAGAERVYAAVATLRRLGLQGVIQKKADGYLLAPEYPVVLS